MLLGSNSSLVLVLVVAVRPSFPTTIVSGIMIAIISSLRYMSDKEMATLTNVDHLLEQFLGAKLVDSDLTSPLNSFI